MSRRDNNIENIDAGDFRRFFLNEVCDHDLLTVTEERDLLTAAQDGDQSAAFTLCLHNIRLVVSVANRYIGRGVDRQDLEAEGVLGLLKAVYKFDLEQPIRFCTYARYWIRQYIVRAIAQQGNTIRLPCGLHDYLRQLHNAAQEHEQATGQRVAPESMADVIGPDYGEQTIRLGLAANAFALSLDYIDPSDGSDADPMIMGLEDEDSPDPEAEAEATLRASVVRGVLQRLPFRHRMVIYWRFGFNGPAMTFRDCGKRLGVTRERARQIQSEALRMLCHPRNARELRPFR